MTDGSSNSNSNLVQVHENHHESQHTAKTVKVSEADFQVVNFMDENFDMSTVE